MPQYATFEQFARDLLLCSPDFTFQLTEVVFKPIHLLEEADFYLDLFSDCYSYYFEEVFIKNEYQDLRTDEQFFRFVIPRCLKLIDSERYFYSMMLIASFLKSFLNDIIQTRYCYRFCFTAYKCLVAVFKRTLEVSFESNGEWKGLEKYFKELDQSYRVYNGSPTDVLSLGDLSLHERMVKLIEECDDVSDECFLLNSYELSLLKDEDIEELSRSLENDIADEDPLDLKWPPCKEEMQEKLRSAWEPFPCNDYTIYSFDSDSEDSDNSEEINAYFRRSYLASYMQELYSETSERLGYHVLKEKMDLRKCPCCGIKCKQFSRRLYLKQLGSALNQRTPKWKKSLKTFISKYKRKAILFFTF